MLAENIKISGHGIKDTNLIDRWQSREWEELACLFIDDNSQSENIRYLLEQHISKVIDGIKICQKELGIEKVKIYLSECYSNFKMQLESYEIEVVLVGNKKAFEKDAFNEITLVHNAETMYALKNSLEENYIPKKIISIAGDVKNSGIYEISFGTSLRQIISEYGGGTESEKAIKFVQVGGNTGAVFTEEELDTPFLYSNLMENGTMLEVSKIEVYNIDTCVVNWVTQKMLDNSKETCGKCVYCREGIYQLYKIIKDATEGKGKESDINLAIQLSETIKIGTLCDFGRTASNPLYTAINKFRDEFEKHIDRKICSTLNCIAYANYFIDPKVCNGCGDCMDCPQKAIKGGNNLIHIIDMDCCDKCKKCEEICSVKAVKRYSSVKPKLPAEPIEVGSFDEGALGEKKGLGLGRRRRK
ncbi:NADH-ubiquinone oxidoreductase-F iron-sulfur binding region domain-containing protein [Clostridium beijerinckii]|uniref:4Fe-4S ferredoxin n=1 Tax=Clostridium beijerinckii TaxID=1520 RepID=A0AAW3W553_CLOBE|nr:NADH-ubiquinone oxidoreductase-F iron-sulfur binding region domain-containing protein [Clostridium beijerinckii]MBC2456695.1 4Fe-4S ferredoxin [Clostridium beijerinckii]MBC2473995.1 4Fe-4S ferredoxin [Clostridium beijerinckii]MDG5853524.1 NADH-ubiquinone oxidoreductase-F iron-sulfur binding region domain-containing protein [Clostridium beijerinckii]NOV61349.1 NADH-quinone oxidoreductase subunit F [Clostridium beijerinckii]NOV69157.1 NADH-quinone oxidoreductase subunit F [Clostridium beijeri